MPAVSAIITTFNRSRFLRKAVASVLAQEYGDFELIILDNSSTDDTESVVAGFADTRIVYVRHAPMGISAARNLGLKTARGKYVGFLDDDDEWLPGKLARQVGLFEKSGPDVALIYGGFHRIRSDGAIYDTFAPRLRGDVFMGYVCGHDTLTGSASNPLMRRELMGKIGGYDENIKTSEDWEFYIRLASRYKFDFIAEPVLNIRAHAGARLGDRLLDAAETELIMLGKFKEFFAAHRACRSYYLQTVGGKYCRAGECSRGRSYIAKAVADDPLNATAWAQLLFSFFGSPFFRRMHAFYKSMK